LLIRKTKLNVITRPGNCPHTTVFYLKIDFKFLTNSDDTLNFTKYNQSRKHYQAIEINGYYSKKTLLNTFINSRYVQIIYLRYKFKSLICS